MPSPTTRRHGRRGLTVTLTGLVGASLAVAIPASPAQAAPVTISIVSTNDFHGRLLPDRDIPGAAKYAGAVNALEAQNPNTVFAAAGDLIGATTFESFIQQDKPTIDVLNAMDLDVSAVGNHELDQGWDDLTGRVMQPESAENPNGGAAWEYIAANLSKSGAPADRDIAPSHVETVGGVDVGFVGAVTEDLPTLVTPAGIEGVQVDDIVSSVNAEADRLKAEEGADVVVMLVHEGAPSTNCATMDDNPSSKWGSIVTGANENVDAIMSGHTHLAYNCNLPVPGEAGRLRPVMSAGQYGSHLSKLDMTVDPDTGTVAVTGQETINVNTGTYEADAEVQGIVNEAKAEADVLGAEELGDIGNAFNRARKADDSENRGGESTLGNMVATVQRWATREARAGGAQIAFMNPGGLRADMLGKDDGFPSTVTYREAANVQPYANTLVNMQLTGRQIRRVLEEQWQPEGSSRPFLRLGASQGFRYTYDSQAAAGKRIGRMWLRGKRVKGRQSYSVTVNSFLASGGDNFSTFAQGTDVRDTGQSDLQAMVDFLARYGDKAFTSAFDQRAVGARWITDNKAARKGGPRKRVLKVRLSSLAFTGPGDVRDRKVLVKLGRKRMGRFAVDNSRPALEDPASAYDETGTTRVRVRATRAFKPGRNTLKIIGTRTGTRVSLPVRITRR